MKVAASLMVSLFLIGGMLNANPGNSQELNKKNVTVVLNNESLRSAFKQIERQTEFKFAYVESQVNKYTDLHLTKEQRSLSSTLDLLLTNTNLKYFLNGKTIVVVPKGEEDKNVNNVINALNSGFYAQEISGTIKNDKGEPLANVSVTVKGTTRGTLSSAGGFYKVEASNQDVLVFSIVGYTPQEISVGHKSTIDVVLNSGNNELDQVVVVGYGTQKRINLSGAVQSVGGEVLNDRPINNVGAGLQGTLPNLNITANSGRPDDAPKFNIRGIASISSTGDPLILVDNIPITASQLATINPSDIANVTILKDAGAAAIYGGRAAFGVVLIITKRAVSKELQINANGNVAFRTRGLGPQIVTDPLTVMQVKHDAATPLYNLYPQSDLDYAAKLEKDPSLPRVIVNPSNPNAWSYYGSTNWLDLLYNKNTPAYTGNVSIAKKDDKLAYYLSAGYYNQQGILSTNADVFHRYNLRSNATYQIAPFWKIGNNTAYSYSTYNYPSFMNQYLFWNANRTPSLSVVNNPDGTYTSDGAAIIGMLKQGGRTAYNSGDFLTTFNTQIDIIKSDLTLKADATFHKINFTQQGYGLPVPYRTGPGQPIQYQVAGGTSSSYAQNTNQNTDNQVYNVYANYQKTFGKHYLNVLVGYNQEYFKVDSFYTRVTNLISSELPSIQLATGTSTQGETINDYALQGIFSRVNYIYDNKYILEFNSRYDGTSRFPQNDRWGFFPSGSAAWVLSKEKFFQPINNALKLDMFKIRGSYGMLGNQFSNSYYPYIATMTAGKINPILDGTQPIGVNMPGVVSSSLTWEKVRTINLGTDISLFKNKLSISYDWYTRYTDGMLTKSKTLPSVFGTTPPVTNAADLKTRGWELFITWRDTYKVGNSPLFVSARISLSNSNTYITRYDNPSKLLSDAPNGPANYYVGQHLGDIWGFVNNGVFQSQADVQSSPDQTAVGEDDQGYKFYTGDVKFKDLNHDGKINFGDNTATNPGDRKIIGNNNAQYPFGIDLNGSWKGFDLRVFLQGVIKRDWYPTPSNIYFWGIYAQPWTNVTKLNLDHWTPTNPNGYFPAVRAYIAEDQVSPLTVPQTKYLQNAAYMRVKNITLGYSLPASLIKKTKIKGARFYFSAENLFTYSKIKAGIDPESIDYQSTMGKGDSYPFQKTYSFGFDLNF